MGFCQTTAWGSYDGNLFDISRACHNDTDDCYSQDAYYQQYMREPEVIEYLGLKKTDFLSCNNTVENLFFASGAQASSVERNMTTILNAGVPVLLYAGDKDATYNWMGIEAVARSLNWYGKDEYRNTPPQDWIFEGKLTGTMIRYQNLAYVRVLDAGHLVGWDNPAAASALFNAALFDDMNIQNTSIVLSDKLGEIN
jgi:cathepsin A (carboxypeptidase C)